MPRQPRNLSTDIGQRKSTPGEVPAKACCHQIDPGVVSALRLNCISIIRIISMIGISLSITSISVVLVRVVLVLNGNFPLVWESME